MIRLRVGAVVTVGVAFGSSLDATRADAQVVGGVAVEAQSGAPLPGLRVRLVRRDDSSQPKPPVVDSGRTDAQGRFQLLALVPGVYQLQFGVAISEGPIDSLSADTVLQRRFRVPVRAQGDAQPYFEFQVDRPVVPARGNRGPRYPEDLKRRNVEGVVLADFVVDTAGRVEAGSFRALRSTDAAFTAAVREALTAMRFEPAVLAGVVVRQRVQQPFQFQLTF